ncbi:hypothetical protein CUR178_00859 [Leishmania enriettii]|uniref:DUF985 domain-containing protein n=1 Tax=Leishmania enriettii TaxID=5663 RepID=A0A836GZM0_LEIEN|nr:hypothetical protein CUR178_00859 [Leishmania enriettii]
MTAPPSAPQQRTAEFWIEHLKMVPHPEGGYYTEVARSVHKVDNEESNSRFAYTTIYFLCTPESPSHLHRLCSDETWLFHAGDPLQVHVILKGSHDDRVAVPPRAALLEESSRVDAGPQYQVYQRIRIGSRVEKGELLQYTVPGGAIFGSSVDSGGADGEAGYSLVSCIVSPGFDFDDFEVFTQAQLMELCPQHEVVIKQMAYETIPDQERIRTRRRIDNTRLELARRATET